MFVEFLQYALTHSSGLPSQFGNVHSVKPQQITFIVPGAEDFKTADISAFINKAQTLEVSRYIDLWPREVICAFDDEVLFIHVYDQL